MRVLFEYVLIVVAAFLVVRTLGLMMLGALALVYAAVVITVQQRRKRRSYRAHATAAGLVPEEARRRLAEQSAEVIRAAEDRETKR